MGWTPDKSIDPYVAKADYTAAYSVLVSQASLGVPENLALSASTLLGRKATGGIAALTGAEVVAILGSFNAATVTVADTASATCYVGLYEAASGSLAGKTDAALLYNANSGCLGIGGVAPSNRLSISNYGGLDGNANNFLINGNSYYGTSSDRYIKDGFAARISFRNASGDLNFSTAPTGLADAAATLTTRFHISNLGNIGVGTDVFGTNAVRVLGLASGTAPTTSPADAVQMWSADFNAVPGKAALHLRDESGILSVLGNNWGLFASGAEVIDATAEKTIFLSNGTAPSAHTDNGTYIYSQDCGTYDSADNLASLAFFTESALVEEATTPNWKLAIKINNLEFWLPVEQRWSA